MGLNSYCANKKISTDPFLATNTKQIKHRAEWKHDFSVIQKRILFLLKPFVSEPNFCKVASATEIKSIFSKRAVDLQKVCLLNSWIAEQQATLINDCLKKWKVDASSIDLMASHGQTIFHAPKHLHGVDKFSNATLQIGDGDHLAVKTGIITISDFRQKHIAAGGEGAPLALYGDYLLFSKKGENRILLNIGGIANFTRLPGNLDGSEVVSTDTGPGNTLMDAYIQQNFTGKYYDDQSAIATIGQVNELLLAGLKKMNFLITAFQKPRGQNYLTLPTLKRL